MNQPSPSPSPPYFQQIWPSTNFGRGLFKWIIVGHIKLREESVKNHFNQGNKWKKKWNDPLWTAFDMCGFVLHSLLNSINGRMTEFISQKMDCIFCSQLCDVHRIQPGKKITVLKTLTIPALLKSNCTPGARGRGWIQPPCTIAAINNGG